MSPSNRDLSDWLIVQAEGKSFVGKPPKGWSPDAQLLRAFDVPNGVPKAGLEVLRLQTAGWITDHRGPPPAAEPATWHLTGFGREKLMTGDWVRLSPIYEYAIVLMNTPQGPQPIPRLQPVWGCLSIGSMTIPARVFVRFADLTAEELKAFTMLVEQTEEGIKQARAQAAGISLIQPGGPLPPYPGRTRQ